MRVMMRACAIGLVVLAPEQVRLKPDATTAMVRLKPDATVQRLKPDVTTPRAATEVEDKGTRLESITWEQAEILLRPEAVVVIPLGAAAKEHGRHLALRNDLTLAEYLTTRIVSASNVIAAPPVTYHYEPAFQEYPGSTSVSLATARDLTSDVIRSLARYGPRRYYVINTGTSSARALVASARALASEGILLRYTDFDARLRQASLGIRQQEGGGHADEVETSMMLYVAPSSVDMTKASKDFTPAPNAGSGPLRLTRRRDSSGTYLPTGAWGDPTLATRDKGRVIVEALVSGILQDIEDLRLAPLPAASPAAATPAVARGGPAGGPNMPRLPDRCTPGEERTIRSIGDAFAANWANGDAISLGALWSQEGDIVHPDGTIERGTQIITINRTQLFLKRQYRGTRHPLLIANIRCLSGEVAVADGKWELRGVTDENGQPVPTMEGLCTLVVKKEGPRWLIEAYRYTIKQPAAAVPPTVLQRPGWPVIK